MDDNTMTLYVLEDWWSPISF